MYPTYNAASYTVVPMFDDGAHGDGLASDGVYAGQIPAMPNKTIVEFFVQASDTTGLSRTWPAAAVDQQLSAQQVTNLLYQVDDAFDPAAAWTAGKQPIYYLIMTEMERGRLADIGNNGNPSRSEFADERHLHQHRRHRDGASIQSRPSDSRPWHATRSAAPIPCQFPERSAVERG